MKLKLLFLSTIVLFSNCSAQKHVGKWTIKSLKTNYVQKGNIDRFELPKNLKGKSLFWVNNSLLISNIKNVLTASSIVENFNDTIAFKRKICIIKREDNVISSEYPGDELLNCIKKGSDTCQAGQSFFKLLGTSKTSIAAYVSPPGTHSDAHCILFIVEENKKMVLYSENDFLLLFIE